MGKTDNKRKGDDDARDEWAMDKEDLAMMKKIDVSVVIISPLTDTATVVQHIREDAAYLLKLANALSQYADRYTVTQREIIRHALKPISALQMLLNMHARHLSEEELSDPAVQQSLLAAGEQEFQDSGIGIAKIVWQLSPDEES